ncbi:MAG: hypothetical protein QHH12_00110 [Candidatus Bathyarchaeota archaeon]|jgi:hypothetical protein|nr:hypothetical protein [Candidatus Bathyarchaeota archaeon A05DMB-3]MDH7606161.1 hypothetical protein [Candidatus Bathyarchaeota archaeon]
MRKKALVFLAVLLAAAISPSSLIVRFSPAMAQEGVVLSAWTCKPPKIDGVIDEEEWSTAAKIDFNITNYNGTIYVMNDGGNLYLAAKITDDDFGTDFNTYDVFMFLFDNDNDGSPEKGDDGLFCFSISGPPYDMFYNVTEPNAWPGDTLDGGTADGSHDETGDNVYNYFECVHPLDSSDDAHDFSLKIGDIVGFQVRYLDNKTLIGFWPSSSWCHIKIASGDLVLSDNDVYTVTGNYYMNGSIIVTDNATLMIENAHLTFMQTTSFQFNITLRDAAGGNPRLIVDNALIDTYASHFRIELYENSTAQMKGTQPAPNCPIYLLLHDSSSAEVSESTFSEISLYNRALLYLVSSSVGLLRVVDESYADVDGAAIYYLYAANGAEVQASDSTITYALEVQSSKTQCYIQGITPGFVAYWNFLENCSVIIGAGGFAPNVTLSNVQVNGWSFSFADAVNAIISDSRLCSLGVSGSSVVCVYRVYAESVSISGYSRMNATDSRAGNVQLYGFSALWAENLTATTTYIQGQSILYVNWYLDVHVVDSLEQDVPDANVTVVSSDGTETAKGKTNMAGWVKLTVLSRIINATGEYPQGPYNVTATYGIYSNTTTVNVNGNNQTKVVLSEFVIPEFPALPLTIIVFVVASSASLLLCRGKKAGKKR